MTTTITVKTHSWPVRVTQFDQFSNGLEYDGMKGEAVNTTQTTLEVPPNSSKDFIVTSTRSLSFEELPMEAVAPPEPIVTDVERIARDEAARVAGVDDEGTVAALDFDPDRVDPTGEDVDPALRA